MLHTLLYTELLGSFNVMCSTARVMDEVKPCVCVRLTTSPCFVNGGSFVALQELRPCFTGYEVTSANVYFIHDRTFSVVVLKVCVCVFVCLCALHVAVRAVVRSIEYFASGCD